MEARDSRYDLVRCIAIVLIVFIHSMGMLNGAAPVGWSPLRVEYALLKSIISPGVHLFILLSGALLLGKEEPIWVFYRKRLRRVLVPFLIWSVIVYILTGLTTKGFDWSSCLPDFGRKLVTNGIHGTYWFIYVILGLYLITPLLRWICRTEKGCTLLLVLTIPLLYFPYLNCLTEFVAGFWLARFLRPSKPVIIVTSVLLVLGFLGDFFQRVLTENSFPFEILVAACAFYLIVTSSHRPRLSPAIRILGDCSLGIYLSHCLFISAFTKAAEWMSLPVAAGPFFVALSVLAAEWLLMNLFRLLRLDRIPVC